MSIQNFDFPSTTLRQEFVEASTGNIATLSAVVIGSHYKTHRADVAKEAVGWGNVFIDGTNGKVFSAYPEGITTSLVDKTTAKVVLGNAVVQYSAITASNSSITVSGKKITFAAESDALTDYTAIKAKVKAGDQLIVKIGSDESIVSILVVEDNAVTVDKTLTGTIVSVEFCRAYGKDIEVVPSQITDSSVTIAKQTVNVDGLSESPLTVRYATAYLDCREKNNEYVNVLGSIDRATNVASVLGAPCKENPLALAVYAAAAAAKGTVVYFIAVEDETLDAYNNALGILDKYRVYSVVPATDDEAISKAVHAAVEAISADEEVKEYRTSFLSINTPDEVVLVEDEEASVSGTSVTFTTAVVNQYKLTLRAGDVLRYGAQERVITEYVGVDGLTINSAFTGTPSGEIKIVRTKPTGSDLVSALIAKRQISSYRGQVVFADDILFNGEVVPNYFGAAAAAGMRSYEPCYRPISNLTYNFFSVKDTHKFTREQLKELGANGIWIIGNNANDVPVNLRQITSAMANDLNQDEESIIANADDIAYTLGSIGENQVGNTNISPDLLGSLNTIIKIRMDEKLKNATGNSYIGPQLLSWNLLELYQSQTNLDWVYATIECEPPKPFNKFKMTLRVI